VKFKRTDAGILMGEHGYFITPEHESFGEDYFRVCYVREDTRTSTTVSVENSLDAAKKAAERDLRKRRIRAHRETDSP
jgi:RNase P protein component